MTSSFLVVFCLTWAAGAYAEEAVKVSLSGTRYSFGTAEEPTSPKEVALTARQVLEEKLPYWFWADPPHPVFRVTLEVDEGHPSQSHISLSIYYKGEPVSGTGGRDSWRDDLIKEDTAETGIVPLAAVPRGRGAWKDPIKYSLKRLILHNQENIESALKPIPIGSGTAVSDVPDQIIARPSVFYPTLKFRWEKDSPRGHIFLLDVDTSSGGMALEMVGVDTLPCPSRPQGCGVKVRAEKFNTTLTFDPHEYKDLIENSRIWNQVRPRNFYWCHGYEGGPQAP